MYYKIDIIIYIIGLYKMIGNLFRKMDEIMGKYLVLVLNMCVVKEMEWRRMVNFNIVKILVIVMDNNRESIYSLMFIMVRELLMVIFVVLKIKVGIFNYKVICLFEFWLKIEWNINIIWLIYNLYVVNIY